MKLVPLWRKPPFVMDCHLALAFAEEGAPALRTLGVKELRFSSIYAWREVAGKGALSRHALGLAMDVFSFVTDDDVVREVETEYAKADPVLLGVEKAIAATGSYRMLLTPGNDPRHHHDHFHFEARAPREKVVIPAVTMPSVPPATP